MGNRTKGAIRLPIVIRIPYGGGIGGVEHHCDSSEAYYVHTAGLTVVTPATPQDAYSLMRAAIRHPDPVVFLEPKKLYWAKGVVDTHALGDHRGGRDRAARRRRHAARLRDLGADGARCGRGRRGRGAQRAGRRHPHPAAVRRRDGHGRGAVDRPGRRRRRGSRFASVASEIAARVSERCFSYLEAPVRRVTGFDVPFRRRKLEHFYLPDVDRILDADRLALPARRRGGLMSAQVFRLPDLGRGADRGRPSCKWLVAVGDTSSTDQPIAEVETAKSVVEVPSPFAGTVAALHGAEGDVLMVGAPFVEWCRARIAGGRGCVDVEHEAYRAEERAGSGNVLIGYGTSEAKGSGATRRPAARCDTRPRRDGTRSASPRNGPLAVRSPIVRRLAQERGGRPAAVTPDRSRGSHHPDDVLAPPGRPEGRRQRATDPGAPVAHRAAEHAAQGRRRQDDAQPQRRSPRRPSGWMSTRDRPVERAQSMAATPRARRAGRPR
jgi:pyruvate/2-oxoglutarate dehydrogenase complex dihydrolipoamide acyltransferase (E2) component